jgi:hypothetical protein
MSKKHSRGIDLEPGANIALYARLVNGCASPWHVAADALALEGGLRPRFRAEAAHLAAAWDARGTHLDHHERIEFGVLVEGRVERVAQTGLAGRVVGAMRAVAPVVRRNLIGGAPRLARFRWPSC